MRKALYLMGVLEDSDIDWLSVNGTLQFVRAGTLIVAQGSPIANLYILLDGSLSVFQSVAPAARTIKELLAGEVIGEIAFVDSRPPTASVSANIDSSLLIISGDILKRKIEKDLGFAARFYHGVALFLADRLRSTIGSLGFGDVDQEAPAEIDDELMDNVSQGAMRFDRLVRQMHVNAA